MLAHLQRCSGCCWRKCPMLAEVPPKMSHLLLLGVEQIQKHYRLNQELFKLVLAPINKESSIGPFLWFNLCSWWKCPTLAEVPPKMSHLLLQAIQHQVTQQIITTVRKIHPSFKVHGEKGDWFEEKANHLPERGTNVTWLVALCLHNGDKRTFNNC